MCMTMHALSRAAPGKRNVWCAKRVKGHSASRDGALLFEPAWRGGWRVHESNVSLAQRLKQLFNRAAH